MGSREKPGSSGVPKGYKGIYVPKLTKLDLTTAAEYAANSAKLSICMVVNVQQCCLLHGMLYIHNNIFLTDIK